MKTRRKKLYRYMDILLISSTVFLMYLIITPPAYDQSGAFYSNTRWTSRFSDVKIPVNRVGGSLLIAVFSDNEFSTEVNNNHLISRGSRDLNRLFPRILCTLAVLISGLSTLRYFRNHFTHKGFRRNPAFAGTIGGHAPPLMVWE